MLRTIVRRQPDLAKMKHSRLAQAGLPAIIVLVISVMILPLPSALLDLLIVANISTAVLILIVSTNVQRALDFSSFPALLLIVTLVRVALNVSTSRAILAHGEAGDVIAAFGSFVVGGNIIVGVVIFVIITLVQFVVISNGAGRVAEVSARFTLDAMPGKQMAIDADLNAGVLTDEQAQLRRREVADEADFYGAMDGASKFVKGDAIAGLVITIVNLIGGLAIGVLQRGMSVGEAVSTYSLLTVGDGLVAQVPALLVSISSGLIVTRSAGSGDLGSDVFGQFGRQATSIRSGGVVVLLMALVPGLPKLPFIAFGVALIALGRRLASKAQAAETQSMSAAEEPPATPAAPLQLAIDARVEPLELGLSYDLIELVDTSSGGDLLDRVAALRRKIAGELGIVMPAIRTRDEPDLPAYTYVLRVHGVEVGRGTAPAGRVLVIGDGLASFPGDDVIEPVFGLPARWVPVEFRVEAEIAGHTVVDRAALVVTHLAEVVRRRAGRLLSRTDVKSLLDSVAATDPAVVEDLTAAGVGVVDVQRVLASLLDEGVPVRDLVRILEAVGERARITRAPDALVEAVRLALGPAITSSLSVNGVLSLVSIDPRFESELGSRFDHSDQGAGLRLDIATHEHLIGELDRASHIAAARGLPAIVVTAAALRAPLSRFVRQVTADVAVVSYGEIGAHLAVDVVHTILAPNTLTDQEAFDASRAAV
jgi:flagellar biosynthesis protein FlhA